jgi:hypothetical protein
VVSGIGNASRKRVIQQGQFSTISAEYNRTAWQTSPIIALVEIGREIKHKKRQALHRGELALNQLGKAVKRAAIRLLSQA